MKKDLSLLIGRCGSGLDAEKFIQRELIIYLLISSSLNYSLVKCYLGQTTTNSMLLSVSSGLHIQRPCCLTTLVILSFLGDMIANLTGNRIWTTVDWKNSFESDFIRDSSLRNRTVQQNQGPNFYRVPAFDFLLLNSC